MKCLVPSIATLAAALACAAPAMPVSNLDTQRFSGTWFEVARLHNQDEADCASDVTAHYEPQADGMLKVTQSCRSASGRIETNVGHAWPAQQHGSYAQLKVSFLPRWLQWLPLGQDERWVVMLDPGYRYAVLSDPTRRSLWVLSRAPTLPADELGRIVDRLSAAGYPTRQLVLTQQSAVLKEIGSDQAVPFTARPRLIVRHGAATPAA